MASVISPIAVGSKVIIVCKTGDILLWAACTLPKLPLPSTMRKLKSWMPTLTLAGPGVWTGGQDGTGVGDRATGKPSDIEGGIPWGMGDVGTSG